MDNSFEKRYVVEIRANADDRVISGTAIVFNSESVLIGNQFREVILPEAVTPELIANSNIVMLWNHEDDQIPLARSNKGKGTLKITITSTGVDFSFKARNTPQGEEILAAVRAGDVDACSFAFIIAEGGDSWLSKPDRTYLRTISAFSDLADFSLVNNPAYTEANCRSLEAFKATEVVPNEVIAAEDNNAVEATEIAVEAIDEVRSTEVIAEEVVEDKEASDLTDYYNSYDSVIAGFNKL